MAATKHGKPWCSAHAADYSPSAQRIMATLERREKELAAAEKNKLKLDSHVVHEAIIALGEQTLTIERLARDMNVPVKAATGIANLMFRHRLAQRGRTKRGSITVKLGS